MAHQDFSASLMDTVVHLVILVAGQPFIIVPVFVKNLPSESTEGNSIYIAVFAVGAEGGIAHPKWRGEHLGDCTSHESLAFGNNGTADIIRISLLKIPYALGDVIFGVFGVCIQPDNKLPLTGANAAIHSIGYGMVRIVQDMKKGRKPVFVLGQNTTGRIRGLPI